MKDEQIVVFSHGFGVKKDDRGLFTDIADGLDVRSVMFNYNEIDEKQNTLTVFPLSKQAEKLGDILDSLRGESSKVSLVCHSQGCVTASLLKPQSIHKAIFLTAPDKLSVEKMRKVFGSRGGSSINIDGISKLARRDGSTTIVPAEYWQEIKNVDPIVLYNDFAEAVELILVNANQDEVIGDTDFEGLSPNIKTISLDANHDFTDDARSKVIEAVRMELVNN